METGDVSEIVNQWHKSHYLLIQRLHRYSGGSGYPIFQFNCYYLQAHEVMSTNNSRYYKATYIP